MTSLPTTAAHGATNTTTIDQSPSWTSHLTHLISSVFHLKSQNTTATTDNDNGNNNIQVESTDHAAVNSGETSKWYNIHLCEGMINDVKRRLPYYGSDWLDAWDYRVVPATVYMYFANILPALAFSLDM